MLIRCSSGEHLLWRAISQCKLFNCSRGPPTDLMWVSAVWVISPWDEQISLFFEKVERIIWKAVHSLGEDGSNWNAPFCLTRLFPLNSYSCCICLRGTLSSSCYPYQDFSVFNGCSDHPCVFNEVICPVGVLMITHRLRNKY